MVTAVSGRVLEITSLSFGLIVLGRWYIASSDSLLICLRDQYNCALNFGHIVIICTNTAEKGHTYLRYD